MKNVAKKFLISTCALTLLACPMIAQAKESVSLEAIPERTEAIMPLYEDTYGYKVENGETQYFINKENGKPFLVMAGFGFETTLQFEKRSKAFEVGVVDENNNKVQSFFMDDQITAFNYRFPILTNVGRYKLYITNYSEDPIVIKSVGILLHNYAG